MEDRKADLICAGQPLGVEATVSPCVSAKLLGKALEDKLEILSRVKAREDNGDFDYVNEDLSNIYRFQDLVDVCILKTPQNKGWILEDFVCRKLGWKHLPPWKHNGDGYDLAEKRSYEIKSSFTAEGLLIKQIRLFQKIDRYIYIKVDELEPEKTEVFLLDHDQMAREVKANGRRSCKGRARRGGNQYDIEIQADSHAFSSWQRHYSNIWFRNKLLS